MKLFIARNFRWLVFCLVLTIAVSGSFIFFTLEDAKSDVPDDNKPSSLPVSFIEVFPDTHAANIIVYGQAQPISQIKLCSPVAGKIVYIADLLKQGMTVDKDQILVKVDDTAYRSRVADAELTIANAKLNLLREEQEAAQAIKNWQQSGLSGEPMSALVLRKPQLNAAQKQLSAAAATLLTAQKELAYCEIRSPFNGLIHSQSVSMGQLLSNGDEVTQITGTDKLEIKIALDADQWSMLGTDYIEKEVSLVDEFNNHSWTGNIARAGKEILPKSRLRQVFCEVKFPLSQNPQLLSGTFLTISLVGKKIPNLLQLPESTITKQGLVWYKQENNRLQSFAAKPVFYKEGSVFIHPPDKLSFPIHIALYPNNAFLNGLAISPKTNKRQG
jgi:membrane fusion protein, multidrug efflux system